MSRKAPKIIDVDSQRIEELLQRAESNTLCDDDMKLMRQIFASYRGLFEIVGEKNTTLARLRKWKFGAAMETSKNVLGDSNDASNQLTVTLPRPVTLRGPQPMRSPARCTAARPTILQSLHLVMEDMGPTIIRVPNRWMSNIRNIFRAMRAQIVVRERSTKSHRVF